MECLARVSNDEDYRWQVLREKIPPWLFQVLNLTFIGKFNDHYQSATLTMASSRDSKYYPLSSWCSGQNRSHSTSHEFGCL